MLSSSGVFLHALTLLGGERGVNLREHGPAHCAPGKRARRVGSGTRRACAQPFFWSSARCMLRTLAGARVLLLFGGQNDDALQQREQERKPRHMAGDEVARADSWQKA